MADDNRISHLHGWRNPYVLALLALAAVGLLLIVLGATRYAPGSVPHVLLVGIGVALAPASLVGLLSKIFLYKEVQDQVVPPIVADVEREIKNTLRAFEGEIERLREFRDAGLVRPYRNRSDALRDFVQHLQHETREITVVGSSLKGLLQADEYATVRSILRDKVAAARSSDLQVRFLLTHPALADLRAFQEGRSFREIGREIVQSLEILRDWHVPPANVRLYRGAPTCFAIKTRRCMILNPYPYRAVAYLSPCLLVRHEGEGRPGFLFETFELAHFGAWDTGVATKIHDFDDEIRGLQEGLDHYAEAMQSVVENPRA